MALPADLVKIKNWADTGDRDNPEDAGLDWDKGWTVGYEQQGSGQYPQREVMNQLFHMLTMALTERLSHGILAWDIEVAYDHPAFCIHGGRFWVSLQPGTGREPASDSEYWREY